MTAYEKESHFLYIKMQDKKHCLPFDKQNSEKNYKRVKRGLYSKKGVR